MENLSVTEFSINEMAESNYIHPHRINYNQGGKNKIWDLVEAHESVAVIIYNKERKCLVCVKQFRPGVYYHSIPKSDRDLKNIDCMKYPSSLGETIEFCAGLVDKSKPLKTIAVEEVQEETGYVVQESNLELVKTFRSSVGICGDVMTMFYTEVSDNQKKMPGGGIDNEAIEIVEIKLDEAEEILLQPQCNSPSEFLYGLLWFMTKRKNGVR